MATESAKQTLYKAKLSELICEKKKLEGLLEIIPAATNYQHLTHKTLAFWKQTRRIVKIWEHGAVKGTKMPLRVHLDLEGVTTECEIYFNKADTEKIELCLVNNMTTSH